MIFRKPLPPKPVSPTEKTQATPPNRTMSIDDFVAGVSQQWTPLLLKYSSSLHRRDPQQKPFDSQTAAKS